MRMWDLDPRWLCKKHLLGEHVEMHMFVGSILKDINITKYITTGLVDPKRIKERHDLLVEEMLAREYNHNSELEQPDVSKYANILPCIDIKGNMEDLFDRCPECYDRYLAYTESGM